MYTQEVFENALMKVVAFLGNPGDKYVYNRHNAGFLCGEYLLSRLSGFKQKKEFSGISAKGCIGDVDVVFIFPHTYMNESGQAVSKALNFYKLKTDDLIVVHDELELEFGEVKLKSGGGHKGNNGIRSIIKEVGNPDFDRIRIGVSRPPHPDFSVADYLLSDFNRDQKEKLDDIFDLAYSILQERL